MKYYCLILLTLFKLQFVLAQTTDTCSFFNGFDNILLDITTLEDIKKLYPNYRIERPRYPERIVHLDSVGIEVHLQKEKFKNVYTTKKIIIKRNCTLKSKEGIGIGSSYRKVSNAFPQLTSMHRSRIMRSTFGNDQKQTQFTLSSGSANVKFICNDWKSSNNFITERIEIYSYKNTTPYSRPTLAFMGMPRIEYSTDFKSSSLYGGFGFYTTYFFTGNLGAEIRFGNGNYFIGPKGSVGWWSPTIPGFQFTVSSFTPIRDGDFDLLINPQVGINFPIGIFYLDFGYNFNVTNNFDIPNSFNLTFGIQFPLKIEKFVSNA